jgi:hypothetical protein
VLGTLVVNPAPAWASCGDYIHIGMHPRSIMGANHEAPAPKWYPGCPACRKKSLPTETEPTATWEITLRDLLAGVRTPSLRQTRSRLAFVSRDRKPEVMGDAVFRPPRIS